MEVWLWFHLVAMAFFVGGQLVLAAVIVPVERASPDPERLRAVARRFGEGSLVAVGVLLVSGAAMASHEHLWGSPTLHVKLALVALAGILVAWHMRHPRQHAIEGAVFAVSLVIVALGIHLAE